MLLNQLAESSTLLRIYDLQRPGFSAWWASPRTPRVWSIVALEGVVERTQKVVKELVDRQWVLSTYRLREAIRCR